MNKKIIVFSVFILLIVTIMPSIQSNIIQTKTYNNSHNNNLVPGEFIIKLAEDGTLLDSSLNLLNEKYKVTSIEKVFKNHKDTILDNIYLFSVPENSDIVSITDDYSSHFDVVYAEANYLLESTTFPNDVNFSNQWALHNTGQNGGKIDADIDAPEAWDFETGSSDIIIAIIDTGIDYNHPDLADNIWINSDEIPDNEIDDDSNGFIDDYYGWDFVGTSITDPEPDDDPIDDMGHGTCVGGIASASGNNGIGGTGVCWNCKLMTIKAGHELFMNLYAVIDGISYAVDNGADVICMSFGTFTYTDLLKDAVDYAYNNGAVLVAGAGNLPYQIKFYPAALPKVVGVAGTNDLDEKWSESAWGDWVDVAAPAKEIYSTLPTYYTKINELGYNQDYDYLDGTSMAGPLVAGIAGLLLSYTPSLTPAEVRDIIISSTDWIETDRYIGSGRVNAYNAMLIASGEAPPGKPSPPSGSNSGVPGTAYTYTTTNTNPYGDDYYYLFDWDDGTYSGWVGPFPSGATGFADHTWSRTGNYQIKVKSKYPNGLESEWSDPLTITMPRIKSVNKPLLNFLESHPNLYSILRIFFRM